MPRRVIFQTSVLFCVILSAFSFPPASKAETRYEQRQAGSPYDLINAVNALRASYGVPSYGISSILMYTAQAQADFMAANGTVTHSGPGGIGVTDRLLAAGYPLAGDLSLGGFRSENITGGGENMTAEEAVKQWTGDAPHLTTMISPDLTEIGAGVAMVNGRVYYVIDCARPTTANAPQVLTTPLAGGSAVPVVEPMQPVMVSTPNAEGNIIHEVKSGQTLWQIAITYDTKIDEIKRLNNLANNDIYPGEKLLIQMGVSVTEVALTEISTPTMGPSSTFTPTTALTNTPTETLQPTLLVTITPAIPAPSASNSRTLSIAIGLIVLALIGGLIASMGGAKKNAE